MEEMCMKKVIEFPQHRSLLNQLEKSTDELIELHDALSKAYNLITSLEDKVEGKEAEYNTTLCRYVKVVGVNNIPVKLLEFASEHLVVDVENGEIRYEPPEDPEVS
tara:strand:+ start:225 stop:542 length:318 start_codon:yes stop_codon:yes gene_type:complete